ncbi:stalk domain-containing protein [Paenibacillus sp. R14(2021)]|uniref:stalk domain-containing protein n=1 Tax=Paenibacillus sp. R14(2021) TaxID=2859228 RepID=UPI001C611445|nr:stalk domain-containing protein [Paenibacillus sp. R14(2021)]
MSMKKTLLISALAAALSTSATGVVSAASAQNVVATSSFNLMVNDASISVGSIQKNGTTFVSLRDLGKAAGVLFVVNVKAGVTAYFHGHSVELHKGSKEALVDGEQTAMQHPIEIVGASYYISVEDFIALFDVDAAKDAQGQVWIDAVEKVHADNVSWIDAGHLLASTLTEDGRTDYIVDAKTGAFQQLMTSSTASELTVSPNGTKAAYTDEDGLVYVIDLTSKKFDTKTVSTDNSIKPELVWSPDSSSIFFLQGDKGTVIQKLNIADGTLTKVLDDKLDYKTNLSVSADGTKFYYVVTKPGAVTADATKPVESDDVAIDIKGTEPQVYFFDASVKDAVPVKLTTSTDDKVFVGAAADGSQAYYVSVEDNKPSSLVAVAKDKKLTTIIGDKDVLQATMAGGKIYALTDAGDKTGVYEVDAAAGTSKSLGDLEGNVSEVVAAAGAPIAFVIDDATYVANGEVLKKVTN